MSYGSTFQPLTIMCDGYPVYTDWCNPESRVDQELPTCFMLLGVLKVSKSKPSQTMSKPLTSWSVEHFIVPPKPRWPDISESSHRLSLFIPGVGFCYINSTYFRVQYWYERHDIPVGELDVRLDGLLPRYNTTHSKHHIPIFWTSSPHRSALLNRFFLASTWLWVHL